MTEENESKDIKLADMLNMTFNEKGEALVPVPANAIQLRNRKERRKYKAIIRKGMKNVDNSKSR